MQATEPLVSIIIPCYNVAPYVERAISSIVEQSYTNLEIWIIDDASTDDTLLRIKKFTDKRIRIAEFKENTKKIGAVNDVLKKVNGEFIAFQDADDWSEKDRIKLQVDAFAKDASLGICFTNYRYISKKNVKVGKIPLTNEELKEDFLHFKYQKDPLHSPTNCPTMMISQPALQRTGGYHAYFTGRVAEDIHWIYRILKYFKGVTLESVLYNYTIRENSFTGTQFSGLNPKYAYSWQLLAKIIHKDIHEHIDVLEPANSELLKQIELEACEDALSENIRLLNTTISAYEKSSSFRLGKLLLSPFHLLLGKRN